jgi:hypothetical protein
MGPHLLNESLAEASWRRRRARMLTWMVAAAAAVVLVIGVFIACPANLAQSAVSGQADATASTADPLGHSARTPHLHRSFTARP